MTSLHWLRGAGSGPPYTPTHSASHPPSLPASPILSSLAHPHFDKRDTEFIRRLRSNCLQAIFTLFAFITSLMRLIMGLLCGAALCFSSRLPVFDWIGFPTSSAPLFPDSPSTFYFLLSTQIFIFIFCLFVIIYLTDLSVFTLFGCACVDI